MGFRRVSEGLLTGAIELLVYRSERSVASMTTAAATRTASTTLGSINKSDNPSARLGYTGQAPPTEVIGNRKVPGK